MMKLDNLIYKMLTANTGAHPLDSGGAYGRNWERNQKRTHADFKNEPEAVLDIDGYADVTISVYHHLTKRLDLDAVCEQFNRMKCDDWDGEFYGVSARQQAWLDSHGFTESERGSFNTYNWSSNFSQVLQGTFVQSEDGTEYVLLQIHGGCDVRGGYTDAKLFRFNDYFLYEDASFELAEDEYLDIMGDDWRIYNRETGEDNYLGQAEIDALPKGKLIGWQIGG